MDSESMNPGRFDDNDEVLGSGNDGEEEQGYMGWERQEEAAPSPTQAEEVSYDDSQVKLAEEAGVSQEVNAAVTEYSGGDAAAAAAAGLQYPESSAVDKDENPEDPGFEETSEAEEPEEEEEEDDGDGSLEEQRAFMETLEKFFRDRNLEFKAPMFYKEELNCLKLWKVVRKLGGYEQVTSSKLWRQVGASFKPPKTCTTISWTFRGFYEKALLEYERFKNGVLYQEDDPSTRAGDDLSPVIQPPGRARRDAAARAMQGWHSQRLSNGDSQETSLKDKSSAKRDKRVTKPGFLKRSKGKSYNNFDDANISPVKKKTTTLKAKGNNSSALNSGLDLDVIDEGPQADWVKINVHQTRDCFEVYALVPGLLREEVRIQCEAGGRLVIAGEPEQPDNPWGVTAFRKVINLPLKIDAHQTSAVVTLHGQLFIRVPFAQSVEKAS